MYQNSMDESDQKDVWYDLYIKDKEKAVKRNPKTFNELIEKELSTRIGMSGYSNIKTIEIGCGTAAASYRFALRGADVTIMDYSESALAVAKVRLEPFKNRYHVHHGDLFKDIPDELFGTFDISMSFGLAEHFTGSQRSEVFKIHHRLLKPGGFSIISVPNSRCIPYVLIMKASKPLGAWRVGTEIPFSQEELDSILSKSGFSSYSINNPSYFLMDCLNWGLKKPLDIISKRKININISRFNKRTHLDERMGFVFYIFGENEQ